LKSVPPADRPPVVPVFFAFRAMVGIGLLMLAAGWVGAFLWWRRRLFDTHWYLVALAWSWWLGFVAVISGWIVTESGRQPWLAYDILRTADATSPVPGASLATTLILFVLVYGVVFAMGIYYINRLINRGPEGRAIEPPELDALARPLASVTEAGREVLSPQQ
jgi:cytochrome d ubiquinol oxidase subunit I